jgi:NAD(P)H-quinone oxidoreductase subunit 6
MSVYSWLLAVPLSSWVFYGFAIFTVAGAAGVAFSPNIVYAAFSLLAAFAGMVGLFGLMSADFLAVVQLMVYVGGILVLMLFAIMLTNKITEVKKSNPISNGWMGGLLFVGILSMLLFAVFGFEWAEQAPGPFAPTTALIGEAFLGRFLLPFEVAGVMLLAALLAAVVVARKEVKYQESPVAGAADLGCRP